MCEELEVEGKVLVDAVIKVEAVEYQDAVKLTDSKRGSGFKGVNCGQQF